MEQDGFVKADSDNLPALDIFTLNEFVKRDDRFDVEEIRGAKMKRSARENYGDSAVGYVNLKRYGPICTVIARICPEHRVKSKAYSVTLVIDEKQETVKQLDCYDCPASSGGCKLAYAFLMWMHRRSEEPAPTETVSYWSKPKLSGLHTSNISIKAEDFKKETIVLPMQPNDGFLQEMKQLYQKRNIDSQFSRITTTREGVYRASMHNLVFEFFQPGGRDCLNFLQFAGKNIEDMTYCISAETMGQSNNALWQELRYGRITASKLYEASRCKREGTILKQILGAAKLHESEAMKRGLHLERCVLESVEQKLKLKLKQCGLFLMKDFPALGASPDALGEDFVVEIKCPS